MARVPDRGKQKKERCDGEDEAVDAHRPNKTELKVHKVIAKKQRLLRRKEPRENANCSRKLKTEAGRRCKHV
jgi:hypothetical protein